MATLIERIKESCNTHDIRNVLGLPDSKPVILCPLPAHVHHKHTPSFSIFWRGGKQWWRCHGSCDTEGDVVDLVGYLRVNGYDKRDPDKIRLALAMLNDRFEITVPVPEPEPSLAGDAWMEFVPPGPEVIEYAATRGLNEDTLKKFKIGQFGHYMTMPCFEEGLLRGIKVRNIWPCAGDRRFWQMAGSKIGIFNHDAVAYTSEVVFIVKGEIPTMLMDQMGFTHCCAPTAGEGSGRSSISKWNTLLALAPRIVIGDNDGPGRILGKRRAELFRADLKFPPQNYQDLDKWLLGDPEHAVRLLKKWRQEIMYDWYH